MKLTPTTKFYLTLALITVFRLLIIGRFELAPDEAYYWTWSQHLDWSYYDQGPMLALVIKAFTLLAGHISEWSVRLGSVALSVVSSALIFFTTKKLFQSERAGWLAFLGLTVTLLFSAGALLMMHDSIMVMFWMAALYFFYRAVVENWSWGWLGGALMLGLGGLSKYTMALFVPGLLLFLVLSPQARPFWKKPYLYLAGVLTAALVSPIVFWNIAHHWASFNHIGDLGGVHQQSWFRLKSVGDFLVGQLGVLSPLMGIFCLAAPLIGWQQWRKKSVHATSYLWLFSFSAPTLLFFFLLSFKTEVYANWPAPAYLAALMLLAGWTDSLLQSPVAERTRKWLNATLIVSFIFTATAHLQVLHPFLPLTGRAADSANRIRGWREVGLQTGICLRELQKQSDTPVFLAARRYQIAGILWFYTPGHPQVQLLARHDPANNQFQIWDHRDRLVGHNAVYVCENQWEVDHVRQFFNRIVVLPDIEITDGHERIRTIKIVFCYHLKPKTQTGQP